METSERELWAIKTPGGLVVSWTCLPNAQSAWLEYTALKLDSHFFRRRVKELEDLGYHAVRVRLTEISPTADTLLRAQEPDARSLLTPAPTETEDRS